MVQTAASFFVQYLAEIFWLRPGQFFNNAYSSLLEVLNQLLISRDLRWITKDDLSVLRPDMRSFPQKLILYENLH